MFFMQTRKVFFALLFTLLVPYAFAGKPNKPGGGGSGGGGGGETPAYRFSFVDLWGFPDQGFQSAPAFITEPDVATGRRLIAGTSRLYPDPNGPAIFHPAVWDVADDGSFSASDPLDLGLPDWAREADVRGLSDSGIVAASTSWARYQDPEDPTRYLFPDYVVTPFGYSQLPTPDEREGWPYGIRYRDSSIAAMNNNHLIVGQYEKLIEVKPDGTKVWGGENAMWQLDPFTGEISMPESLGAFHPRALNDAGVMVGDTPQSAAVYYGLDSGGNPIVAPLPTLPGYDTSEPIAISQNSQWVSGKASIYVEGSGWYFQACVWNLSTGTVQGLGTLSRKGWNGSSVATGVNNAGQVVGWSDTGRRVPQTAFLWESGSMIDLNVLTDTGTVELTQANGISNDGRIIGVLRDSQASESRAFVLIPVP